MAFKPQSDAEAAEAITRLVDGTLDEAPSLSDGDRREIRAWVDATPEVSRAVALQSQVKHALATEGPATPQRLLDALGERLAGGSTHAEPTGGRVPSGRWGSIGRGPSGGGWRPAIALGVLAVVAGVIVAILIATNSAASPSITKAARLAFVNPTEPAPAVASPHYLHVSYGGVTFPNYARLHAAATGELKNKIDGRPALTVYYRLPGGKQMSYTVFSGAPAPLPQAARLRSFQGVPLHVYRTSDGLSVVTLVRHGRTCVLAASTPENTVLGMAAEPVLVGSG